MRSTSHFLPIVRTGVGRPTLLVRVLLFAALLASAAGADTYVVGVGTGCTHATLDSAFAAVVSNAATSDTIRIAVPSAVLASAIEIDSDYVDVFGGFSSCTASAATGTTDLHYTGPGPDAFWVHGAFNARIHFFDINVQIESPARLVRIEENGKVALLHSTVVGGVAPEGGNIWMKGASAHLLLGDDSQINLGVATAGNGGGIYCEAGGRISFEDRGYISANTASGSGGGVYLDNCEFHVWSDLGGSPGGDFATIEGNEATTGNGGGIAAVNGSEVMLGGTEIGVELFLRNNEAADGDGGGMWLSGTGTSAQLWNTLVLDNIAHGSGGGILVASGASLEMDTATEGCGDGRGCSVVGSNQVLTSGGGGIAVLGGGSATVKRTVIRDNYSPLSAAAVGVTGAGSLVLLEGCEIYGNDLLDSALPDVSRLFAGDSAAMTVAFSTMVENVVAPGVGAIEVFNASSMRLLSSIVQATRTFELPPPPATQVDCTIVQETASVPGTATFVTLVASPAELFELATPTDFRILNPSAAVDYCDTFLYIPTTTDIEGFDRGVEEPAIPDFLGPFDLGADEWQAGLFLDGFETGDMSRWHRP